VETIVEKSEKAEVRVSEELAEEVRKWLKAPQAAESESCELTPERLLQVRFDLD
jgi:hypothetical protein